MMIRFLSFRMQQRPQAPGCQPLLVPEVMPQHTRRYAIKARSQVINIDMKRRAAYSRDEDDAARGRHACRVARRAPAVGRNDDD